jgi:acetylornithine/N-succinyldiaminopimelate aminotransferase
MADDYLMPTYNRQPLAFERGEGVWLETAEGERYLDAIAGIAVCNLGHCHPAVTHTIAEQAARLVHTSNLYRIPEQEKLARALCRVAGMEKVFFSNSGAEANEAAIKLARLAGHARDIRVPRIVVMENSFHGRTLASLSATGNAAAQKGFEPLVEGFVRVPFNDLEAVKALAGEEDIVAVLVEPIQGEGGVRMADDEYLPGLRRLCDDHDWLLMLDEVQTGNGRTGRYFACQHQDVLPDVITTAKGLGNGFPLGACMARGRAAEILGPGSHGSTYGGSPLACATALTVVETLTNEVLPNVEAMGQHLRQRLSERLGDLDMVVEIRGRGLMTGVELDRPCAELVALCRDEKLLANVAGGRVIRLLPPLVISEAEVDELVDRLARAVHEFARRQEAA